MITALTTDKAVPIVVGGFIVVVGIVLAIDNDDVLMATTDHFPQNKQGTALTGRIDGQTKSTSFRPTTCRNGDNKRCLSPPVVT